MMENKYTTTIVDKLPIECFENNVTHKMLNIMEEKYYTPTIEEFYIGQEIELHNVDNYKADYSKNEDFPIKAIVTQLTNYPTVWVKSLKTENIYEVYPDMIALKHLDREDIESLGWDFGYNSIQRYEYKDHIMHGFEEFGIWTIKAARDITKHKTDFLAYDTLFEGRIKNKSELKRVLKQVGVL